MPKLKDTRKIINVTLPSDSEVSITMRDGILAGDLESIEQNKNDHEKSMAILAKMIEKWNLEDDDGKPLPITVENIKKMSMTDVNYLLSQATFVQDFMKKAGQEILKNS